MLKQLIIHQDENLNKEFTSDPECLSILSVYPGFYRKVGFDIPWVGYFFADANNEIKGCGGYKGKPVDGKIEIAYGTFKKFERQGIATEICRQLVILARETDKEVKITARTLPENNTSTRVLKRNGFCFAGEIYDEEDGNVWEWEFNKPI